MNTGTGKRMAGAGFMTTLAAAFAGALWLGLAHVAPPSPLPADAPATAFLAERAMAHVRMIAAQPHPVESPSHAAAAAYLVSALEALGLEGVVQERRPTVPRKGSTPITLTIRNIVAGVQGTRPSKAVLLVAYYDTTPQSPGASDNTAAVATLLETARALLAGPRPGNDVIFLFTDGEEVDRDTDENVELVESAAQVDRVNAAFYSRFPYPPPASTFSRVMDPSLHTRLLNQNLGDFDHRRIPVAARIWIAGCGTNQAIVTALRFPQAQIVGSDVSTSSLDVCAANARQLGVSNIELREESINGVAYRREFDLILSTGVIHHNAESGKTLAVLANALKPAGVLELMVYNRFHRLVNHAVQKAVRTLAGDHEVARPGSELAIATELVASFDQQNIIGQLLR